MFNVILQNSFVSLLWANPVDWILIDFDKLVHFAFYLSPLEPCNDGKGCSMQTGSSAHRVHGISVNKKIHSKTHWLKKDFNQCDLDAWADVHQVMGPCWLNLQHSVCQHKIIQYDNYL